MEAALELARLEGVAAFHRAALQPQTEPANALLGAAVGECIGNDITARAPLNCIVANRGGRAQCFLDIAALEDLAGFLCVMCPQSRETVGL